VKLLIVDEKPDARECLIRHCERSPDIQIVGAVGFGKAAMEAARPLDVDLMLLNADLPDMSGFELLRAMESAARPLSIMLSNCSSHAINAFAEGAIDYLLTPIIAEQFDLAMARARHRFGCTLPGSGSHARDLCEFPGGVPNAPRFLVGQRQRRLYPLDPKSIDYIEADGNYVTLRAGKLEYLSRDSIKRLSMRLAGFGFIRIERSLLVNAAAVLYAETAGHGTFALTLNCGICLHSSPAYRESILRTIPLPASSKRYRECSVIDSHMSQGRNE